MARPAQIASLPTPTQPEIQGASYVGSKEHKRRAWWGGLPGAHVGPDGKARRPKKQVTTICPLHLEKDRTRATEWVQDALRLGQFRFREGDKTYPKHIWHRDENDRYWFGFCINGIAGTYKGWPVDEAEKREVFG